MPAETSRAVTGIRLSLLVAAVGASLPAPLAQATFDEHVINPQLINIYWEVDGGGTVAQWNKDVNATCDPATGLCGGTDRTENGNGTGPASPLFTVDSIDSLSQAILLSDYFKDAERDYGVLTPALGKVNPTLLPSLVVGQCGSPPTHMDDLLANVTLVIAFMQCVENLPNHPELANGNNTVFNIWLPPWVLPTQPGQCFSDGAVSHNTFYVGSNCTGGTDPDCKGHWAAVIPTYPFCNGGSLQQASPMMMHEFIEDWGFGQVCDQCHEFEFLAQGGMTNYWNDFTHKVCEPQAAELLANPAPTDAAACGAGKHMVVQTIVDAKRNPVPWDLPGPANGYSGSLYGGLLTQDNNNAWIDGLGHYVNTLGTSQPSFPGFLGQMSNPVMPGSILWTSPDPANPNSAFVQFNGFAAGYGAPYLVSWDATVEPYIFDINWGQPSSIKRNAEDADARTSIFGLTYPPLTVDPPVVAGALSGSATCGVKGHVVGPLAIGDSTARLYYQGNYVGPVSTDEWGNISQPESLAPAGAQQPLMLTHYPTTDAGPGNGYSQTELVDVYPVVNGIAPAYGPVAGTQQVTLTGRGWKPNQQQKVMFQTTLPNGVLVSKFSMGTVSADGTSITLNTPGSPLPAPGVGPVSVYAAVDNLWATSAIYTYIIPGTPYVTFGQTFPQFGKNCGAAVKVSCTATVYDNLGVAEAAFNPITLAGGVGVAVAPAVLNSNPGTALCTYWPNVANDTVTAAYNGANAKFDLPGVTCIPLLPLICDPSTCWPPMWHRQDYAYVDNGMWVNPFVGDPQSWSDPFILSIQSPFPSSDFNITALGAGSIVQIQTTNSLALQNTPSTSGPMVMPVTAANGQFIHFTGSFVGVSLKQGQPNWDVKMQFPLAARIPAANYRVFGYMKASNIWVEMKSSLVTSSASTTLVADAVTTDPHGLMAGVVTGPYALTYYSNTR